MEVLFPKHNVRCIAVSDNYASLNRLINRILIGRSEKVDGVRTLIYICEADGA